MVVHTGNPRAPLSPRCEKKTCRIYPPGPRIPVTTKMTLHFLGLGNPNLDLHFPLLLGGGTTQGLPTIASWVGYFRSIQSIKDQILKCPLERLVGRPMSRNEENAGPSVPGFWQMVGSWEFFYET